jgi:RNA polymerase-associated protein LEO1
MWTDRSLRPRKRKLDDEELDSGDDEGRNDRVDGEADGPEFEAEVEEETVAVAQIGIGRHAVPQSSDEEVSLLKAGKIIDRSYCSQLRSSTSSRCPRTWPSKRKPSSYNNSNHRPQITTGTPRRPRSLPLTPPILPFDGATPQGIPRCSSPTRA